MSDKFFLDSNIIVYALDNNPQKKETALKLLRNNPIISTQVINEIINVCSKKFNLPVNEIENIIKKIRKYSSTTLLSNFTIDRALEIKNIFNYSYFDCLILSSALESDCKILYSEDLQNGQIVNDKLKIINPFLPENARTIPK